MTHKNILIAALMVFLPVCFSPVNSHAGYTYTFDNVSANRAKDAAAGESQLSVFVELEDAALDRGTGDVALFTFQNIGNAAMSITDIYFQDNLSMLGFRGILDADDRDNTSVFGDAGVDFSLGARPGNLPSGNNVFPAFKSTIGLDSDAPTQPKGVNPDESLRLSFYILGSNAGFRTMIDAIASGELRIGLHVQGFDSGGSESFVNSPGSPEHPSSVVPEPNTMLLLGFGLMGITGIGRRKRHSTN